MYMCVYIMRTKDVCQEWPAGLGMRLGFWVKPASLPNPKGFWGRKSVFGVHVS